MPKHALDPVDEVVGRNVCLHRTKKGLSQTELGDKLGVTFEQIQQYEKGYDRIESGCLLRIAMTMGVPMTAFFEGGDAGHSPATSLDHAGEA
jgi:transcriptional regulator with XRE-family HTH domain